MMEWNGFDKGGREDERQKKSEERRERLWMSASRITLESTQNSRYTSVTQLAEAAAADLWGSFLGGVPNQGRRRCGRDPLGNDATEKGGRGGERARKPSTSPAKHFKVEITTK